MKIIFADTFYWVALINPKDQWHQQVKLFSRFLDSTQIVTTDEILTEFLVSPQKIVTLYITSKINKYRRLSNES